jgi:hypothetical protein
VESKKNVIFWLAEWIILALLWLVLVAKLEWSEIWIGLATSALARHHRGLHPGARGYDPERLLS